MSKNRSERNRELLIKYFKEENRTSQKEFERLLLEDEGKTLESSLLSFIYDEIDNIIYANDINYLFKAIRYLGILTEKYPNLNRDKIKRKLKKTVEKIDRLKENKKNEFYSVKKVKNRIKRINDLIYDLNQQLDIKQNKYYDLLAYFIFQIKNIEQIEEILKMFPYVVNAKKTNKNGSMNSIFFQVLNQYISEIINYTYLDENEDILYYKNIISLFYSKKEFEFENFEKIEILNLIYANIYTLSSKKSDHRTKLALLTELKDIIKQENEKKTITNIAKYYNIKVDFSDYLIEQLNMYQTSYSKRVYPNRKIVDDYMITIDSKGAIEIDDGLTAKKLPNGNYLIGVHIASVLGYLPYYSDLVTEAISRGSSIYNNNISKRKNDDYINVIPIFPYNFSARDASFIENEKRLANSYFFEIDNKGNIVNESFQKTIVTNNRKCSYQEINKILDGGGSYSDNPRLEQLAHMLEEIMYLLNCKHEHSEIYSALKQKSNDPANIISENTQSGKIVSQAMILVGNRVAEWFKDPSRDYPCLLRVHEIGDELTKCLQKTIEGFKVQADNKKFDYLYDSIMGIYPKAHYDLEGRHEGLNLDHYCHITSPLRRSADIVMEHALDVCYFQNPNDYKLAELEKNLMMNKNIINAQNNAINYFLDDCKFQKKLERK